MKIIDNFSFEDLTPDKTSLESSELILDNYLSEDLFSYYGLESDSKESFIKRAWEWIKKVLKQLWNFITNTERKADAIIKETAKTAGFSSVNEMESEAKKLSTSKESIDRENNIGKSHKILNRKEMKIDFLTHDVKGTKLSKASGEVNIKATLLTDSADRHTIWLLESKLNKDPYKYEYTKEEILNQIYRDVKNYFTPSIVSGVLLCLKDSRLNFRKLKRKISDLESKITEMSKSQDDSTVFIKNLTILVSVLSEEYKKISKEVIYIHNEVLKMAKEFFNGYESKTSVESKLVEAIYNEYGIEGVASIIRNLSSK